MSDATERLINLALFLSQERGSVSARDIREQVEGYPADQDEQAFLRMFERDKKELRAAGLVIDTVEESSGATYALDRAATFQTAVDLDPDDVAILRAVGAALVNDPAFPFREALSVALAKLAAPPVHVGEAHLVDERPEEQGRHASELSRGCIARKRAAFSYEDAHGRRSERTVEPYGLFLRDGRWYLVAHDVDAEDERVFALRRIDGLQVEAKRPGTPDFEVPDDVDVAAFARLPFQYGDECFEAVLDFAPDYAWRAPVLTEGRGALEARDGGALRWTVDAADALRLARWVVENGPGITLRGPEHAAHAMADGLRRVVDAHV